MQTHCGKTSSTIPIVVTFSTDVLATHKLSDANLLIVRNDATNFEEILTVLKYHFCVVVTSDRSNISLHSVIYIFIVLYNNIILSFKIWFLIISCFMLMIGWETNFKLISSHVINFTLQLTTLLTFISSLTIGN